MTASTNAAAVPLTEADIQRIANEGVKSGELSWIGFDKDALGFYTIPVLSQCHFQFARLVARSAPGTEAAPVELSSDAPKIARWAKWIARNGKDMQPDHACAQCVLHSDILKAEFQCVYHEALAYHEAGTATPVDQADLVGAQFAAAQHLHTVQVQADALAALRVERDLLSASLKQRDGLVDQLVAALKNAHPYVTSDAARIEIGAALASAGETS